MKVRFLLVAFGLSVFNSRTCDLQSYRMGANPIGSIWHSDRIVMYLPAKENNKGAIPFYAFVLFLKSLLLFNEVRGITSPFVLFGKVIKGFLSGAKFNATQNVRPIHKDIPIKVIIHALVISFTSLFLDLFSYKFFTTIRTVFKMELICITHFCLCISKSL